MAHGLTEPVKGIRDALPTSRHAQMLFDMVEARLGDLAVVETAGGRTQRYLYRREGPETEAIIPWPLIRLGTRGRLSAVHMLSAPPGSPEEAPPRPGEAPKLRGLGPGQIEIHDGPHRVTVTYGDDGRWMETSRSKEEDAHAGVVSVLARGSAQATELVAEYLAGIDLARHGPGRVLRPEPLPLGITSIWNKGRGAIRDALYDAELPTDARWAVVDSFKGKSLTWGATREEAVEAWRREIEREQPQPKIPEKPVNPQPDSVKRIEVAPGQFRIQVHVTGPAADLPWPAMVPEVTPAVVIPVAACPHEASPWGRWLCLIGAHGETVFALQRRDLEGSVLVGEGLVALIDLECLEETLDGIDVRRGGVPTTRRTDWPADRPPLNSLTVSYRVVDEDLTPPIELEVDGMRQSSGFQTKELQGERLRDQVLRQRWLPA